MMGDGVEVEDEGAEGRDGDGGVVWIEVDKAELS